MTSIAVLVCTYGGEEWKTLAQERAIPSAVAQAQDTDELQVHHFHGHGGTLAASRNYAAQLASRDWLCFLDADDELAPGYLDAMRAAVESYSGRTELTTPNGGLASITVPQLALFAPAVQYVRNGFEQRPRVLNDGRPLHDINRAVIGTLVYRSLFLAVGGFPEEDVYEDWACWLACERAGATLVDVPDAVYRAHVRDRSRNTPSAESRTAAYMRIRRAHFAALQAVPA